MAPRKIISPRPGKNGELTPGLLNLKMMGIEVAGNVHEIGLG